MEETHVASLLYQEINKKVVLACLAWTSSTYFGIASIYYKSTPESIMAWSEFVHLKCTGSLMSIKATVWWVTSNMRIQCMKIINNLKDDG